MTFARVKPANWGVGEKLTSAQVNAADAYWPDVIDGAGGGTWAPTDPIIIGGDGLAVTGPFSANNATVTGTVSVIGTTTLNVLDVNDLATFTVGVVIASGASINVDSGSIILSGAGLAVGTGVPSTFGGTVDFNDAVVAADDFTVLGATSLAAATAASLVVGSAVTLDATTLSTASGVATTLGGPVALSNTMTVGTTGRIAFSGAGRIIDRVYNLPDADVTVSIADGTLFIVPALGAPRTYTMSTTGATAGDRVRFSAFANSTANVASVGAVNLRNAPGVEVAIDYYFNGSAWLTEGLDVGI